MQTNVYVIDFVTIGQWPLTFIFTMADQTVFRPSSISLKNLFETQQTSTLATTRSPWFPLKAWMLPWLSVPSGDPTSAHRLFGIGRHKYTKLFLNNRQFKLSAAHILWTRNTRTKCYETIVMQMLPLSPVHSPASVFVNPTDMIFRNFLQIWVRLMRQW